MSACECGREKASPAHEACEACAALDGSRDADRRLISALREMGGVGSSEDLEKAMEINRRFFLRLAKRNVREGRLLRVVDGTIGVRGTEPKWVLVEEDAGRRPKPTYGPGQLVFSRPGFVRACKHSHLRMVRTEGGEVLAKQCAECTAVLWGPGGTPGRGTACPRRPASPARQGSGRGDRRRPTRAARRTA